MPEKDEKPKKDEKPIELSDEMLELAKARLLRDDAFIQAVRQGIREKQAQGYPDAPVPPPAEDPYRAQRPVRSRRTAAHQQAGTPLVSARAKGR